MTGPILTAELVRNADACIGLAVLLWVLFDSHSKRPDVISLKGKLDLLRRQLLGGIVSDILNVVEAGVESVLASSAGDTTDDQFVDYISPIDSIRSDTVRDGLTRTIASSEGRFKQLRRVSRLPKTIHSLNVAAFWLFVSAVVVAFSCAGILLAFDVDLATRWALLGVPVCVLIAAGIVAVIREAKNQDAEKQILDFDPQV